MPPKYDVLVVGSYSIDLIFTGMPGLPELGKEVIAEGFDFIPGEAYTSAVAMHRLGLKVGWAADFGNDVLSRFALEKARSEGLDESLFIHHKQSMRRISVAASFPHERSFLTYYDPDPTLPAAMRALARSLARVLFVPGLYYGRLMEAGLKLVRLRGMKLVMDGNSGTGGDLRDPRITKAIKQVDVLLPNANEALRLTGKETIEDAIYTLGELCPLVVVKAGAQGSYAVQNGNLFHQPAIHLQPLDTTGAGDCFNAGFLRAWLDDQSIDTCLRWGNIVGGLSTLARGGTGRVVTMEDIWRIEGGE